MLGCNRCVEQVLRVGVAAAGCISTCATSMVSCLQYPYTCLHNWREDRSHLLKTHHDWYFLLWRCTFPLLTLLLVFAVSGLGQLAGVVGYALSANSVWFYCTFVVVATPFLVVFRFPSLSSSVQSLLWKVLFVYSVFNSAIELFVWTGGKSSSHHHMGQSKLSWLMGSIMFGIVGWIGIPFFFSLHPRLRQDTSFDLPDDHASRPPSPTTGPGISMMHHHPSPSNNLPLDQPAVGFNGPVGMAGKMALPGGVALFLILLLTVASYFPMHVQPPRASAIDFYWSIAYFLAPILILWLLCHTRQDASSSSGADAFNLVVLFSTVLTHVPIFVGHLCLTLFAFVDHPSHAAAVPKLAISCLFLVVMQAYFYLLTKVIQSFSAPYAHPSLLYAGQLYFYVFWYLLVGSDTPIDGLYFAMLALSNLHVVLANTGVYTDVHSISVSCCLHPKVQLLSMCVGSSVAVCFRASQPLHPPSPTAFPPSEDEASTDPLVWIDPTSSSSSPPPSPGLPALHRRNTAAAYETITPKKDDELQQLYFLMKLAEQDHMADTSALVLVPSILTWLAFMEPKEEPSPLVNMWLRCLLMFGGRVAGSFLAREIFAYKMHKNYQAVATSSSAGGLSGVDRLRVQRIMLADFRRQFWYLAAATTVVAFGCFDKPGWPARYAFYTT
ncbi:Aste57867_9231 [Aphanomyces stellatus]|uniref:Aste57867_9231 protein n=1 Tax=Aphanomyces stellatus TaxID=120398 RepID=A0A485KMP4_9STRA|nr:hypothetical protein As57867_009195 [Aphanomyces stellatus]VFT86114.1 Aste57867_9231 [Aphanomyces stellatus]